MRKRAFHVLTAQNRPKSTQMAVNSTLKRRRPPEISGWPGPIGVPLGFPESTPRREPRKRGPCPCAPLPSRVGSGPPFLHFTSAVFLSGIPGFERGISRLPLLHRHHHTPHRDSEIFKPRVLSVSGRWSCPRTKTRIDVNTIFLFVIISWFSPRHNELE